MTTAADLPTPAPEPDARLPSEQSAADARPDEATQQSAAVGSPGAPVPDLSDALASAPPEAAAPPSVPDVVVPTPSTPPPRAVFDGQAVATTDTDRPRSGSGFSLRRPRERRRARRVIRVIRRIDLWSVLKLSLVLYTCLYAATLAALVAIWGAAYSTGLVGKLQSFLGDVGLDNFRFYGDQMFRACAAIGAVLVLAGTLITVLTVALINLISELTGGIRIVIIEEEPWPPKADRVAVAEVKPLPSDPAAGL